MVKQSGTSDHPVMRFSALTAIAVVAAYVLVVLYGLDVLDHIMRPVLYAYRHMGPH
jgi:hypothetical protein